MKKFSIITVSLLASLAAACGVEQAAPTTAELHAAPVAAVTTVKSVASPVFTQVAHVKRTAPAHSTKKSTPVVKVRKPSKAKAKTTPRKVKPAPKHVVKQAKTTARAHKVVKHTVSVSKPSAKRATPARRVVVTPKASNPVKTAPAKRIIVRKVVVKKITAAKPVVTKPKPVVKKVVRKSTPVVKPKAVKKVIVKRVVTPKPVSKPAPVVAAKPVVSHPQSCEEIVRTFKAPNAVPGITVKCVDTVAQGGGDGGTLAYADSASAFRPFEIQIKRGLGEYKTKAGIVHEYFHATSWRWSASKQTAFVNSLGKTGWFDGGYYSSPAELWAYTAGDCIGWRYPNSRQLRLPGGCSTVNKWMNN